MNKELMLFFSREDNLDRIQKQILQTTNATIERKNISNEMFQLFFGIMELGREVRKSIKENDYQNTKLKIADLFLFLVSLCNDLHINLFDCLQEKEQVLNGKVAKWF